nr:HicB family protein [uncultured Gammaproteobacteria bacterium]
MNNTLKYKGYEALIEFDAEERLFFGKVLHIDSLLMFHGQSVEELEAAFHEVVEDYLKYCQRAGVEPNKPYRGSFNVRIGPDRHRRLASEAKRRRCSLNELVCEAVDLLLDRRQSSKIQPAFVFINFDRLQSLSERMANPVWQRKAWTGRAAL